MKLKIYIPEPCSEDWSKMKPNDIGKFCDKCSKSVYDLSYKTETEIEKLISEKQNEHICCRIKKSMVEPEPFKFRIPDYLIHLRPSPIKTTIIGLLLLASLTLYSCNEQLPASLGKNKEMEELLNKKYINGGMTVGLMQFKMGDVYLSSKEDINSPIYKIKLKQNSYNTVYNFNKYPMNIVGITEIPPKETKTFYIGNRKSVKVRIHQKSYYIKVK